MPRFSANLEFLFSEFTFDERFAAARQAGFAAVEFMFPYNRDIGQLMKTLAEHRMKQDLFNLPAGDFAAGERGTAINPSRAKEFRQGARDAARIAGDLGCAKVNCLVGRIEPDCSWLVQYECLIDNLRWAVNELQLSGITLQIELLNAIETPGYFISDIETVDSILADVPGVMFQFDIYHLQRTSGELVGTLRRLKQRIGHIQIADAPERSEPGLGEINYRRMLNEIDTIRYEGFVGLEYRPSVRTLDSLGWIGEYGYSIG